MTNPDLPLNEDPQLGGEATPALFPGTGSNDHPASSAPEPSLDSQETSTRMSKRPGLRLGLKRPNLAPVLTLGWQTRFKVAVVLSFVVLVSVLVLNRMNRVKVNREPIDLAIKSHPRPIESETKPATSKKTQVDASSSNARLAARTPVPITRPPHRIEPSVIEEVAPEPTPEAPIRQTAAISQPPAPLPGTENRNREPIEPSSMAPDMSLANTGLSGETGLNQPPAAADPSPSADLAFSTPPEPGDEAPPEPSDSPGPAHLDMMATRPPLPSAPATSPPDPPEETVVASTDIPESVPPVQATETVEAREPLLDLGTSGSQAPSNTVAVATEAAPELSLDMNQEKPVTSPATANTPADTPTLTGGGPAIIENPPSIPETAEIVQTPSPALMEGDSLSSPAATASMAAIAPGSLQFEQPPPSTAPPEQPEPVTPQVPRSAEGPLTERVSSAPVPAPKPAEAPVGGRIDPITHVVRRGETFYSISRYYYGSGRFYRALWMANREQVPDLSQPLWVGSAILVPAPENLDRSLIDPPRSLTGNPPASSNDSRPGSSPLDERAERTGRFEKVPSSESVLALPRASRPSRVMEHSTDPQPSQKPESSRFSPRIHVVSGPYETMRSIARQELGDPDREQELLDLNANLIEDSRRLSVGDRIRLPEPR